jgi:DNA-binding HTH domain-containing proteins
MSTMNEEVFNIQTSVLLNVLDRFTTGIILVNSQMTLLYRNHSAGEILSAQAGLALKDRKLVTALPQVTSKLHELIAAALAMDTDISMMPGAMMAISRPPRPTLLNVLILPIEGSGSAPSKTAVLFIFDTEWRLRSVEPVLTFLYRLTHSEARLAALLARGNRLQDAAVKLGICMPTARTHLQHLFRKTTTNRQAELIQRIVAGPAGTILYL